MLPTLGYLDPQANGWFSVQSLGMRSLELKASSLFPESVENTASAFPEGFTERWAENYKGIKTWNAWWYFSILEHDAEHGVPLGCKHAPLPL